MKINIPTNLICTALATVAFAGTTLSAQTNYPNTYPSAVPDPYQQYQQDQPPLLSVEELDQVVGPIALYPDPLIAQVLPASTYPLDVVKAARLVKAGVSPEDIDRQDWDPSVKAVAHYPSVLEMMDSNIDWMQQLGQAFMVQPDDVMNAVQRLRGRARDLGNLVTTPQEQVYLEDQYIRIVPASPEIIYVPVYEPRYVYYQRPTHPGWFISFGSGFFLGSWLNLDCDWHSRTFYRPGWSWNNHWRDHFHFDHDRVTHVDRDRGHDFDRSRGQRPPEVWRRDNAKPLTLSGRPITRPSAFNDFRGRDGNRDNNQNNGRDNNHDRNNNNNNNNTKEPVRPNPAVRTPQNDRGRDGTPPQQTKPPARVFEPNRSGPEVQRSTERGDRSRGNENKPTPKPVEPREVKPAPAPTPTPTVITPKPAPQPPARTERQPRAVDTPKPAPTPPPRAAERPILTRPTPPARSEPARVVVPPVKIAPPPPTPRAAPPAYVAPPQRGNNNDKDKGRGRP